MTYKGILDWIFQQQPQYEWAKSWFNPSEVFFRFDDGSGWEVKAQGLSKPCNKKPVAIGCTGWSPTGHRNWIGWDLDVGHGDVCYETKEAAIQAARDFREFLGESAEIRLSKSGNGVHIRTSLRGYPLDHPFRKEYSKGKELAKILAERTGLKVDPAQCSRQMLDWWVREPKEESFQLISSHIRDEGSPL